MEQYKSWVKKEVDEDATDKGQDKARDACCKQAVTYKLLISEKGDDKKWKNTRYIGQEQYPSQQDSHISKMAELVFKKAPLAQYI